MHQLGNFFHQAGLVDGVGDFGDDDAVAARGHAFDFRLGPRHDAASARVVGFPDAAAA